MEQIGVQFIYDLLGVLHSTKKKRTFLAQYITCHFVAIEKFRMKRKYYGSNLHLFNCYHIYLCLCTSNSVTSVTLGIHSKRFIFFFPPLNVKRAKLHIFGKKYMLNKEIFN